MEAFTLSAYLTALLTHTTFLGLSKTSVFIHAISRYFYGSLAGTLKTAYFLHFSNTSFMDIDKLANLEVMRKANRCATLFELLCEALGHEPMSPTTTWREVAKSYSLIMEDAFKLQNPEVSTGVPVSKGGDS